MKIYERVGISSFQTFAAQTLAVDDKPQRVFRYELILMNNSRTLWKMECLCKMEKVISV